MTKGGQRAWLEHVHSLGARGHGLQDALVGLVTRARQPHTFEVTLLAFGERLGAAVTHRAAQDPSGSGTIDADGLAIEDLYLATGVLEGVPAAISVARARFAPTIARILERLVPAAEHDDTRQRLETHLLADRGARGPALASFRGSGSLDSWVRAVCTRRVVDDARARARVPTHAQWRSQPADAAPSEAELRVALHDHTPAVRAAMERAFGRLSVRERNLIRYSVFHGLNVDELGALYAVHRATAARWLARARTALTGHVEDDFARHLGASTGEAASMLRALRSRLDVSIRSFLASTVEAEPDGSP